jgi:hypothetical protein
MTLLVKSKTRSKAGLQTMFESQRDRVHASGEADSHGIEIDRRDLTNIVNYDESTIPLRGRPDDEN